MQVPNGFLPDYGDVFGDRAHGLRYGWTCDISHDANDLKNWGTPLSSQIIPDRFDKCYLPVEWEIELPNQKYSVEIGYANYGRYLVTYGCAVEGQSAEAGSNHDGLPLKTTVQVCMPEWGKQVPSNFGKHSYQSIDVTCFSHAGAVFEFFHFHLFLLNLFFCFL